MAQNASKYKLGKLQFDLSEPLLKSAVVVSDFMPLDMFNRVKSDINALPMGPGTIGKYHTMMGRWESPVSFDIDIEEFFLDQAKKLFNDESLQKAYFFACRYQKINGCVPNLWDHLDQNGTQTTIDITIENTAGWGIIVENEEFMQKENEAILFCGQQHHHSRPPYPTTDESRYVTLLFLHFTQPSHWFQEDRNQIRKYGRDGDIRFFNINRFVALPDIPFNQPVCSCHDYSQTLELYDDICGADFDKEPEMDEIVVKHKTTPAPGIEIYSIDKQVARKIKGLVQNSMFKLWQPAEVLVKGKPAIQESTRSCFNFFLNAKQNDCHPQDPIVRAKISIETAIDKACEDFRTRYSIPDVASHHTVLIRYEHGDKFVNHYDLAPEYPRVISASMFLNEDFNGGQLYFKHFNTAINSNAGDIVLFCSSFPYMHEVKPVTNGIRYAAVKWYEF